MPAHPKRPELPARTAKLFRNGRNQALRIPRDFEFAVSEVVIYKDDDRLIVEPLTQPPTLATVLATLKPLTVDFPETPDPVVDPEDIL